MERPHTLADVLGDEPLSVLLRDLASDTHLDAERYREVREHFESALAAL